MNMEYFEAIKITSHALFLGRFRLHHEYTNRDDTYVHIHKKPNEEETETDREILKVMQSYKKQPNI